MNVDNKIMKAVQRLDQRVGDNLAEEAWAMSLGFDSADAYWAATREAFESELHAVAQFEGNAE
jgi:hypothetical protein